MIVGGLGPRDRSDERRDEPVDMFTVATFFDSFDQFGDFFHRHEDTHFGLIVAKGHFARFFRRLGGRIRLDGLRWHWFRLDWSRWWTRGSVIVHRTAVSFRWRWLGRLAGRFV